MVASAVVHIDARDHLLGRLASVVAKELLAGQHVVVVRCDELCVSGSIVRNRVKYAQTRQKKMNTNPGKGPFTHKGPAKIFWRCVRGMVNQKTDRGQAAMGRLSTFEGIPHPYDKVKRMVVPCALRVLRLKPGRNFTVLGDLANSVGWKHQELLKKLEAKRKVKAEAFYVKSKASAALKRKATEAADTTKVDAVLAAAGY